MSDLREVPTDEGKLYLAAVTDCFSRSVVGWAMDSNMRTELVVDALELALARRRFATRAEARTAIFDYLECFYNPTRRHSSLGNVSPAEFERRAAEPVPA